MPKRKAGSTHKIAQTSKVVWPKHDFGGFLYGTKKAWAQKGLGIMAALGAKKMADMHDFIKTLAAKPRLSCTGCEAGKQPWLRDIRLKNKQMGDSRNRYSPKIVQRSLGTIKIFTPAAEMTNLKHGWQRNTKPGFRLSKARCFFLCSQGISTRRHSKDNAKNAWKQRGQPLGVQDYQQAAASNPQVAEITCFKVCTPCWFWAPSTTVHGKTVSSPKKRWAHVAIGANLEGGKNALGIRLAAIAEILAECD